MIGSAIRVKSGQLDPKSRGISTFTFNKSWQSPESGGWQSWLLNYMSSLRTSADRAAGKLRVVVLDPAGTPIGMPGSIPKPSIQDGKLITHILIVLGGP